jgi:hypothetical protein
MIRCARRKDKNETIFFLKKKQKICLNSLTKKKLGKPSFSLLLQPHRGHKSLLSRHEKTQIFGASNNPSPSFRLDTIEDDGRHGVHMLESPSVAFIP